MHRPDGQLANDDLAVHPWVDRAVILERAGSGEAQGVEPGLLRLAVLGREGDVCGVSPSFQTHLTDAPLAILTVDFLKEMSLSVTVVVLAACARGGAAASAGVSEATDAHARGCWRRGGVGGWSCPFLRCLAQNGSPPDDDVHDPT